MVISSRIRDMPSPSLMNASVKCEYALRAVLDLALAGSSTAGPIRIADIASRQQIPQKFLETILSDLRKRGLRESDLTIAFEMGLMESAKHAVMAGAGVTYVSKFAVATETANGTLAVVRLADFRIERNFTYVHLRRRVLSRAACAFLAYLEEQAARLS